MQWRFAKNQNNSIISNTGVSGAKFKCKKCGHMSYADLNASKNIAGRHGDVSSVFFVTIL